MTLNNASAGLGNGTSNNYGHLRFTDLNATLGGTGGSVVFANGGSSINNTVQQSVGGGVANAPKRKTRFAWRARAAAAF